MNVCKLNPASSKNNIGLHAYETSLTAYSRTETWCSSVLSTAHFFINLFLLRPAFLINLKTERTDKLCPFSDNFFWTPACVSELSSLKCLLPIQDDFGCLWAFSRAS
ncbi:hypothetical protein CDIK_2904 [Cucumispora dikerogammari]|nr:hypothetical protein CDIK_2904 [Cucumispora dikerogammari]